MSEDLKAHPVEISENSVIVVYDRERALDDERIFDDFASEFHARFPSNLVLILSGEFTFETMETEHLESLLRDLIDHQRGKNGFG